jgi:hypothetical protein
LAKVGEIANPLLPDLVHYKLAAPKLGNVEHLISLDLWKKPT